MGSGTKHDKRQSCQEEKHNEQSQKKKHKKRTKKIESQLKDQIEFYFSDSNLQKDRFLKQAISKNPDGYVSVKTIADFNRMKQLTNDISLVIKAIKYSSLLQLNDDESMVRRTTPLPEARNVDAETVYVEKLPPHADHDWLRKIFSQFGKVTYVSLPRFKHTGDIKGFAFIEFETPKEANTAVQTFSKEEEEKEKENGQNEDQNKPKRRKRSQSESDADDKQTNKTERKRRRTISESSADSHDSASRTETLQLKKEQQTELVMPQLKEDATRQGDDGLEEGKGTRKRKKSDKAVHWENEEAQNKDKTADKTREESEEERPTKRARSSESESNTEHTDEEHGRKKKRKRKAKEKKESKLPMLRVISKLEWLRLKEEYKQLQRQSMQELKKQLQECQEREVDKDQTSHQAKKETKGKETKKETGKGAPEELPFTPGVVLRFKSSDKELQKKDIRDKLTAHAPVAYIDLTDGSGEGYVRFHTTDNCTTVLDRLSNESSSGLQLVKLTGEEEHDYWKKINADRVARFQAKREKKRGTEKIARKADTLQAHQQVTHIRFDDD